MSQNSLVLPTSGTLSGLAAVEALNAALDTLNTFAAGASAPANPAAGQMWHDTTNNLLRMRSVDNTAWITLGAFNETNHTFNAVVAAQPNLFGLLLSNDTSAPTSMLDIAPGGANDSTGLAYMRLSSATRKNVTAAWSVGNANGSLDTGAWEASQSYHVHLIYDSTSASVDVLTSLSYSNPSLPTGYTNYVPIGAIYSNASSDIQAFVQNGSEFLYAPGFQDVAAHASTASTDVVTLTVPKGPKVNALIRAYAYNGSTGNTANYTFCSPDEANASANVNASLSLNYPVQGSGVDQTAAGTFNVGTNTSGQIDVRWSGSSSGMGYSIFTYGYIYPRGLT